MTNNGSSKVANYGAMSYDSPSETQHGKSRIPTSATEIELLDDLPPPPGTGVTTSENEKPKSANNYHTLSMNRVQPTANIIYQDGHDPQLNDAVDRLLGKYAPDAAPQNLINNSTSRRAAAPVNVTATQHQPIPSTFQTNMPPPNTASHNYSSVVRPNTSQLPQSQPHSNQNHYNNVQQASTRSRPDSNYDSFQHSGSQAQQPNPSKSSVSIKTKGGHITQVVPGKLYTLDDDPLHLLYDRQNPVSSKPQTSFKSTFQPSPSAQHNPEFTSTVYTNTSQRYPQQPAPTLTTQPVIDGFQPFDLGNLIKRVQQDYLREIQPFVSSVKFVEKDQEFGQNLNDIDFTTPITVRKGFTRQADDLLRHSFGGRNRQGKGMKSYHPNEDSDDYSDDDVNELRPSNRQPHSLQKFDSRQSFTSVTSASTEDSDYDIRGAPVNQVKTKVEVHDQATSPPPKRDQTNNMRPAGTKAPGAPAAVPSRPNVPEQSDDETTPTATTTRPATVKPATRIPSGQQSIGSSESSSDAHDDYTAAYNHHEGSDNPRSHPPPSVNAVVTTAPVAQPTSGNARDRVVAGSQALQRSEDIRPTPPTIRPGANTQTPGRQSDSEKSDTELSGSEQVSESEDERKPTASTNAVPSSTAGRSTAPPTTSITPGGRPSAPPTTSTTPGGRPSAPPTTSTTPGGRPSAPPTTSTTPGGRGATTPQTNSRDTQAVGATTNARSSQAAAATTNPPTTARTTVENNPRAAAGAGQNPNIHFVPPDQRNAGPERGAQPAQATAGNVPSGTAAHTGSTRLFQTDTDQKNKISIKDAPAAVGNKIKSLFRRK